MTLKVLTIDETRHAEAAADAAGYGYAAMMQAAGRAVADRALVLIEDRPDARVTVIVGSGNNGGDGLVAGRLIAEARPDAQVRFYLQTRRTEDDDVFAPVLAAGMFTAYQEDDRDGRALRHMVASADLVIDALYGIGVRLPIKGDGQKILRNTRQALNERARARRAGRLNNPTQPGQIERAPRTYVLAVDCPSGVHCDSGAVDANALLADETVTFIAAKPGLLTFPAAGHVGVLYVASLEFPEDAEPEAVKQSPHVLLDNDSVVDLLPPRPVDGHKNTFGRALIVGGSANYIGAPAMAGLAAYRSGAGLVTIAAPSNVIGGNAAAFMEATWLYLPHDMGAIAADAVKTLIEEMAQYRALAVGPGMGLDPKTRDFLKALLTLKQTPHKRPIGFNPAAALADAAEDPVSALPPLVIDADGLNLLAQIDDWPALLPAGTIITPHPGEMARLCGLSADNYKTLNPRALALEKAQAWSAVVVLKGAHTVIAAPDGRSATSPFKTTALATAGTGDILTGLIAGLLAQGLTAFDAAQVGVYIHGRAGVTATAFYGRNERSVTARDVLEALPFALDEIEGA
jgi:NAD(P)H-hydrate epimerase